MLAALSGLASVAIPKLVSFAAKKLGNGNIGNVVAKAAKAASTARKIYKNPLIQQAKRAI